jgi:site-specific DNA-cytosine methylase
VEHDKVATHVYMSNHNSEYNETLADDGIEHIHYQSFEYVRDNLNALLEEHGRECCGRSETVRAPFNNTTNFVAAIDIIIGGPPCVDYALVNARRRGVDGSQGKYMVQFGELVVAIKERQRRLHQRPVFFLAENTAIGDQKDRPLKEGDLSRITAAFGLDWSILFDSRMITPLRRKRTYLTNIPFLQAYTAGDPKPSTCFDDDGFDLAGNIKELNMITRSLGLMASSSRIDDDRMNLYMKKKGRYYKRKIKRRERERLMGIPEGYVEKPGMNRSCCEVDNCCCSAKFS